MSQKQLSTSALARELGLPAKHLFQTLMDAGCIQREDEAWVLTNKGAELGGTMKSHPQHGTYIAWDEKIKVFLSEQGGAEKLITAVALGKYFNISKFRVNPILSELGLVQKSVKGWAVTKLGESLGGKQFEFEQTGIPYVSWEPSILTNDRLLETFQSVQGVAIEEVKEEKEASAINFRDKFEAKHRAADGHYVRSRAEMLIDNWLYMSEIVHAYERRLPVEEEVYCDFYLPVGKVYIEFWGLENDERYAERKKEKLKVYEKYGFNLIDLNLAIFRYSVPQKADL
ncbi:glycerol kinase [Paenibacillus arenilitoris]|uniref:Glycerol kinase n=1 Tax=Paenibacillus arenilitoris TaxID=2772299 RepID=A0A927CQV0_9BACL|nr:glycerol kinase [Paenibacillus arenilitoris]MBD2871887.1 glycerol kinase [Paenibacillus arenilitoris]